MKLGILTFHCAHNYGAILQCFSLQEYLKSLGHEVYVIDYRPEYLTRAYKRHSRKDWICASLRLTLYKLINEPFYFASRSKRHDNFKRFIDTRLNLYPYTSGMNFSDFDAIFLGSDQIWEAPITNGKFDGVYFGEGAKCKVISYAASNKAETLSESDKNYYKNRLRNFAGIGVRETTLQKLLSAIIDKPVELNIDPTLLASTLLIKGIEDKRLINEKYILIYEVVEHRDVINRAKEYANNIGARVVILSSYIKYTDKNIRDQEASPSDFVNYIRHAECVFTTSFHGTAISILCQTPFYSFKQHNASDLRIESLLGLAGLSARFVEMKELPSVSNIDYFTANKLLGKVIRESKDYIDKALSI